MLGQRSRSIILASEELCEIHFALGYPKAIAAADTGVTVGECWNQWRLTRRVQICIF